MKSEDFFSRRKKESFLKTSFMTPLLADPKPLNQAGVMLQQHATLHSMWPSAFHMNVGFKRHCWPLTLPPFYLLQKKARRNNSALF